MKDGELIVSHAEAAGATIYEPGPDQTAEFIFTTAQLCNFVGRIIGSVFVDGLYAEPLAEIANMKAAHETQGGE